MKKTLLTCAMVGATFFGESVYACAGDGSQFVGDICMVAAEWCPVGYVPADGKTYRIADNQVLFSVIGYNFGGHDLSFAVPDLRARSPVGTGYPVGRSIVKLGWQPGQERVTIDRANLPSFVATLGPIDVSGTVEILNAVTQGTGEAVSDITSGALATVGKTLSSDVDLYSSHNSNITATPNLNVFPSSTSKVNVGSPGGVLQEEISTIPPQLGITYCIAWEGNYPIRP